MKQFSIIVPVYNEKAWIKDFLYSLYHQTRQPDEIIIVDGNSTDGTLEILEAEEDAGKIILASFPCNIAQARNYAIKHAKHEIILCTDAGCLVDHKRCESMIHIYETTDEKVVAGISRFIIANDFQKKLRYIFNQEDNHILSSRNLSFTKEVWKDVKWYPEYLTKWWEDTYFNLMIQRHGYDIFICKQAIVSRHLSKNFAQLFKMFQNYTQWDAEILAIHHTIQSQNIYQALIYSAFFVLILILFFTSTSLSLLLLGFWFLVMWIKKKYKNFLFNIQFYCTKFFIVYGFWKWLCKWLTITSKK